VALQLSIFRVIVACGSSKLELVDDGVVLLLDDDPSDPDVKVLRWCRAEEQLTAIGLEVWRDHIS
jgi:hypothetical protein